MTDVKRNFTTRNIVLCALFSALIAIGAFIKIPIPYVSFSMQTMFVALSGMLLGKKYGLIAVAVYIIIGLAGLPIFTQGGGITYVLQPSFGYLIGFLFYSYLTGRLTEKIKTPTVKNLLLAQIPGLLIMYAIALPYFYLISNVYLGGDSTIGVSALFIYCFAVLIPGEIVKMILSALLGKQLIPILRK